MVCVSVLMSSYNHEKYIAQAIESVLDQTFRDLELIVVDDCSTDNSRKIIESYQAKDPRVKSFFHSINMGIPATANDCLRRASGKYISYLGSDDLWMEDKLEKQLRVLEKIPNKLVWSEALIIDGKGTPTGKTVTQLLGAQKMSGYLFEELLREQTVLFQSLIFSADYVRELRRDEKLKFASDHRFIVELSRIHPFYFIEEPLAKYRMHGGNITAKNGKQWASDRIAIRKYFLKKYSNEISVRTKADLYYKIGHAYSLLGDPLAARYHYLKALRVDHFHSNGALYLLLALTAQRSRGGEKVSKMYYRFFSSLKSLAL